MRYRIIATLAGHYDLVKVTYKTFLFRKIEKIEHISTYRHLEDVKKAYDFLVGNAIKNIVEESEDLPD